MEQSESRDTLPGGVNSPLAAWVRSLALIVLTGMLGWVLIQVVDHANTLAANKVQIESIKASQYTVSDALVAERALRSEIALANSESRQAFESLRKEMTRIREDLSDIKGSLRQNGVVRMGSGHKDDDG